MRRSARSIVALVLVMAPHAGWAQPVELPRRDPPRPRTTDAIPHETLDVTYVARHHDRLFELVFALPGVENRPANVVEARTIWVPPDQLTGEARAELGDDAAGGLGHIHNNGSLHLRLPAARIAEIEAAEWGVFHPSIADYTLLFRPRTEDEVRIVVGFVVESYNAMTDGNASVADLLDARPLDELAAVALDVPASETDATRCPGWQEMLDDGQVVQLPMALPVEAVDLTLSIAHLNRSAVGPCVLGAAMYEAVATNVLEPGVQGLWVGVTGASATMFAPERLWLVQDEQEPGLALKGEIDPTATETRVGTALQFVSQHLAFFEAALDPARSFRVVYVSQIGPVSVTYAPRR